MRDIDKENDLLFTKFIRGDKLDEENIIRQYRDNDTHCRQILRKNSNRMYMDIISFSAKDTAVLSNETLSKIARKYVKERSKKSIAVSVVHRDKEHTHLHILLSAVEYKTGLNTRLSRTAFKELKLEMERYTLDKFPEIKHSKVQHEKVKKKTWLN
jgi:hypothetical protein